MKVVEWISLPFQLYWAQDMQKVIQEQQEHLKRYGTQELDEDSTMALDRLIADRRRQKFAKLELTFKEGEIFSILITTEVLWKDILAAMKKSKKHWRLRQVIVNCGACRGRCKQRAMRPVFVSSHKE